MNAPIELDEEAAGLVDQCQAVTGHEARDVANGALEYALRTALNARRVHEQDEFAPTYEAENGRMYPDDAWGYTLHFIDDVADRRRQRETAFNQEGGE